MLKRHEIKVLLRAGHTQTDVARLAGVSRRSVQRVAIEGAITAPVDDHTARQVRGIGRPSVVEHFRKFVVDLFEQEPTLKSVEVCRRAGLAGYTGRKSALYALIASVRPRDVVPLVRFDGVPGEFSQHDFGEVDVEYLDGTEQRVRFFASRLNTRARFRSRVWWIKRSRVWFAVSPPTWRHGAARHSSASSIARRRWR